MPISLLPTKFHIPYPREQRVSRPRLVEKITGAISQPGIFVLISGPAGFGKTTLLSEFVAQLDQSVAWVSLDEEDNDPVGFWSYLIAACQTVLPSVGQSAQALLQLPQTLPDVLVPTVLVKELAGLEQGLVLVLDDYHAIQKDSVHSGMAFLLDHMPEKLHLILLTRVDPPWRLARLRARNQLIEIREKDLRFSTAEAAAFLNQAMGLNLSAENVAILENRTEGWAAGLQLAALSMVGRTDKSVFLKAFAGSHVYVAEYLVEEVLQQLPDNVQTFLLQTSILKRLNASLCEAVTGCQDGQAMLDGLLRRNIFVIPLDDEARWFRYHQLFADLLQARLQQLPAQDTAELHRRASGWYEGAGLVFEAVEHALAAADYSNALRLVEKEGLPTILQAHVRTVESWLQAIPPNFIAKSPKANMVYAWLNLLRGTFEQANPYLERLSGWFSPSEADKQEPALMVEWLALQSKLLNLQGKPAESCELANRALQLLPEVESNVRSMLHVNLAMGYEQMLDYEHAAETFQWIVQDARAAGNFAVEIMGISGQAQMVLQQGQLRHTFEIASMGVNRLETTGKSTPFSATLYGELGQIHYQWHHLDEARSFLLRSVQASGPSGYSDPEIYYHLILARIFQMQGDWEGAAQEMELAGDLARAIPPVMIRENIISQQVRVDLALNRLNQARALLEPEGFSFGEEFKYPQISLGSNILHPLGLLYNSALRVLLAQARLKNDPVNLPAGIELGDILLAGELKCRQIPAALETLLLLSQIHQAGGNEAKRLEAATRALELGEPEGFISIFVEEGPSVHEALAHILQHKLNGAVPAGYMQEILAAFPKAEPAGKGRSVDNGFALDEFLAPVEKLTPRELEILQRIAAGDSNQSIAGQLIITLSAVKKHTGNIFNKLNVNSRTQAIARARQLGLLNPAE